jgi:predicted RNase H-like HicB family nuclease
MRAKRYRYLAIIRRVGRGYSADIPDVPGCVAAGDTVEETRRLLTEALELHFELMSNAGERLPRSSKGTRLNTQHNGGEEYSTWVEVRVPAGSVREKAARA